MTTNKMAPKDPDIDMMDIDHNDDDDDDDDDDDFDADELDAYFQAHGLDEVHEPFRWVSPDRGRQAQEEALPLPPPPSPPPPSGQPQRGHESYLGGKDSRWKDKGKGKAVEIELDDGVNGYSQVEGQAQGQGLRGMDMELEGVDEEMEEDQDYERPPPSYQPPVQPRIQQQTSYSLGPNAKWKGKEKEKDYGRGDVLGLDAYGPTVLGNSAGLETRNVPGFGKGDVLGNPAGFGKGDVLGRDAGFTSDVLARDSRLAKVCAWLDQATESGIPLKVLSKDNAAAAANQQHIKEDGQTKAEGRAEGEGKGEAAPPIDDLDSEASIAARPIVSHDPDHPDRPIDLDVKLAKGVIRHVILSEKFPEVWPLSEAKAEAGAQKMVEGRGQEGKEKEDGHVKDQENKGTHGKNGVKGVEGAEDKGLEKETDQEANDSNGQTDKKEVVIPKGVVMLVKGIQYLKMPSEYLDGSQLGSEYEYEDDSQLGSTPASEIGNQLPRTHGNESQKVYNEADVNDSNHTSNYSESERGQHSVAKPAKELDDHDLEIPETDLSSTSNHPSTIADSDSDSDIPMSNTDYPLPPPSSQVPPQSQSSSKLSRKRTWSQRHDPSSPSSSPSAPSPPSPPAYPTIFDNRTPPPRPPSSNSVPSQPPMGPPDLVIRLLLYDGEFWVQAILRPEFHYLVLGRDFDEWASVTYPEVEQQEGDRTKGNKKKGDGKKKTAEEIAKEEEEKEQEKWQKKWQEKARGDVMEGGYVRLMGDDVVVEFEEVDFEPKPVPQLPPVPMKMPVPLLEQMLQQMKDGDAVRRGQEKGKGIQGVNGKQQFGGIHDDGIGDPEKLDKLRREILERKWLEKWKEVEAKEKARIAKEQEVNKLKEDGKPKTTKMVCLVVGHMVPVGLDRKFMREVKKAQLKAMAEELGPALQVTSTASDKMDLDKKDEKSNPQQPWWVPTGYVAELDARDAKRRKEEAARAEERRKIEEAKEAEERKERTRLIERFEKLTGAQMAKPVEKAKPPEKKKPPKIKQPDPRFVLPEEWKDLDMATVDGLIKEWEKQNKPKEPEPPKPPKPEKKPIITARRAPPFHPSFTAQEIFLVQNPQRKPVIKAPEPVYVASELRSFQVLQDTRPAAIVNNQQMQRKRILELPPRGQRRPQQQGSGPGLPPHLQPNPLLQPPRPQAQIQPRPQPQPQLRPQPQLQRQPPTRLQPRPQLLPQPPARPFFQPQAQTRPQFLQQQPRPQAQPQHQPRLQPQPQPPPKPNPHLATDPTTPLKLCPLHQIPHLPYPQNWMVNVLAIIVSISDVQPSPMPPTFNQRIVRLADQSTPKHILLNVFLDAEDFDPKPGEVVLLMGVKNHKYEGGCLKKYWSDRPPEGCLWKWWVGEEELRGVGWCREKVEGLRGWWRGRERDGGGGGG
ncbi:hypothetical protein NCU03514 [Neurospora crassa OR74A]|uniref:Telomeric single stranded DNA binding POT1/Cdc13 domain-containing protein n=2 Tax=Neurospora crassa TaxID=5141 RepID=Q7RW87_NEUCR|nr:hypothetical protein NCU03514 [Neurospora crassa OR74A]EAA26634.2 hypothetical protein NCU03514 [Neurospora crassa OR74A]CAC09399.1 hypothetical protein [Neurospora crassa]|eukprot:XP_955870.2 hypothetical protein NCU03514 [Neurospora crassa OR74A]